MALLLLAAASPAPANHAPPPRFPSSDPDPRIGTPTDPEFDCAELDDEDHAPVCSSVWEEQFNLFGFAPDSTQASATYKDLPRFGQGQISGISADRAWKVTTGSPEVAIAIIDTGIVWSDRELRLKIRLNPGELEMPDGASAYDADGNGEFNADDYASDPGVDPNYGANGVQDSLDGQDLIEAFSDLEDDDGNGYIDDIAGWDFFDDDNDPFDASSYSSAENHGTGRAKEAAAQTDNGVGGAGVCPRCRIMPLRLWDTFIAPADTYAMATIYAADNGALVQEVALGVLQNSRFAQAATQYAFRKGVALMQVSSDLNTSNHNYPTNYNNTVFVAGTVADTHGLGQDNAQFANFLRMFGVPAGSQIPVGTWFRNSNLTQFGGHAGIVTVGTTGSEATGQAAGAAGLVHSRGVELAASIQGRLSSNEVKQILTLTAEDVLFENTAGTGASDFAQPGWDQHFGYGRVDLRRAVDRVAVGMIPPEAGIESPAWFMPLDPVTTPDVAISGFAAANRAGAFTYQLAYAPGLEPLEASFVPFGPAPISTSVPINGILGTLPLDDVAAMLPGAAAGVPPLDPHQYAFTVRLRVTDDLGNTGEDRKTLFAYHDATTRWSKFVDTGGESSLRFSDLDGDGLQETIAANTSGEINVYNHDGNAAAYFNSGQPFEAPIPSFIANHLGAPAFTSGDVLPGRGGFTTPAIGDLDRDGYPEVVAVNGDHIHAVHGDGSVVTGFPVAIDPAFSAPALRTKTNHLKTGIFSSPVLADLDKDGYLDIIAAAMDQHAYAWNSSGAPLPGWPVLLQDGDLGAESINTPAVADIDMDGFLDVIVATNENYGPETPTDIEDAIRRGLINLAAGVAGVVSPLYAIHHDGTNHTGGPFLENWPVRMNGLIELLPLVGPGVDAVVAEVDPTSPGPEVLNGAFTGEWIAIGGDGSPRFNYNSSGSPTGAAGPGTVFNTAEHAAVGDVTGAGTLGLFKGGFPAAQAVNLLLVGQNIPFNHVLQGWEAHTGHNLPGWPKRIDDYQILTGPSIANVGGAPDREVIAGSGLYLLHAFGPTGIEPLGFPKFTGGWLTAVTPVADVDHDGFLEIANWTREGNLFMWDTDAPACGGNNEWWGARHDDYNTGTYGVDSRPPSPVLDLRKTFVGLTTTGRATSATLSWTAPGEDHFCDTVTSYEVRMSRKKIRTHADWLAATVVPGPPAPGPPGSPQTMTIQNPSGIHFAVRSFDDVGNLSPLSRP